MRCLIGFVVALVLVASPLSVGAQEEQVARPSWLESELAALVSAHQQGPVTSVERLQVALIPEHLERRMPGHTKPSQEPVTITEEGQSKGMSRGGKIAIGVVVPLVVGAAIGAAFGQPPLIWVGSDSRRVRGAAVGVGNNYVWPGPARRPHVTCDRAGRSLCV